VINMVRHPSVSMVQIIPQIVVCQSSVLTDLTQATSFLIDLYRIMNHDSNGVMLTITSNVSSDRVTNLVKITQAIKAVIVNSQPKVKSMAKAKTKINPQANQQLPWPRPQLQITADQASVRGSSSNRGY